MFVLLTASERFELSCSLCHYAAMKQISISELQSDARLWIEQAVIERQIVITDQGQPIAALIPFISSQSGKPLPNREARINQRSSISVDSAVYVSEMRD